MMFNLKLFVLVGILAGFRDVYGTEDVKDKDDDGFIVDGLKNTKEENEVKVARDERRVIKAVYEPWSCGNVPIIHESFKDKLFKVLVRAGKGEDVVKEVDKFDVDDNGRIYYNMGKNVEYTVYFIFKKECFDDGELYKLLNSTESMFNWCTTLIHADLSNFNTKNVENMSWMFGFCLYLKELNLSNFDTKKVTNMSRMFYNCSSLTKLDLSKFDAQNVTNMSCMFYNCSVLTELNLSKFDTQNVTGMTNMFSNCYSLKKLDLSKFDTKKVTNMADMFTGWTSCKQVFLPVQGTQIKKRCICCGDEYVRWNNHEVGGLNPKIVQFKDPI